MIILREWLPSDRTIAAWVRDLRRVLNELDARIDTKLGTEGEVILLAGEALAKPQATLWTYGSAGSLVATAANHFAWIELTPYLRTGQTITRLRCICQPGTAEGTLANKCHLYLSRFTADFKTPAASASSGAIVNVADNGTTTVQVIDSGGISHAVDNSESVFEVAFEATNTVGAGTVLHAVEITVA